MTEYSGSTTLFAIFVLSLLLLFLIPWTLNKFLCQGAGDEVAQPWAGGKQQDNIITRTLKKILKPGNIVMIVLWVIALALLYYVSVTYQDLTPFDPLAILGLEPGATEAEVKAAYRAKSLLYHPDKNPSPEAAEMFQKVTDAQRALTDPVAIENMKIHGHPDGPQSLDLGVALPQWVFPQGDKKTSLLVLSVLVGGGIIVPLVSVAVYLVYASQFTGSNSVQSDTFAWFLRQAVKESMSLNKVPEGLTTAAEFHNLPTPKEQGPALEQLRKLIVRELPDLKDKTPFWRRSTSIVKANLLLLAHVHRLQSEIPKELQKDMKYVLSKLPNLLNEFTNVSLLPRAPFGYPWLAPTIAAIEMSRYLVQAVPISAKGGTLGKKSAVDNGALLQLPYMDSEALKKLKKRKVNNLQDLLTMKTAERTELFRELFRDRAEEKANEMEIFLQALPQVEMDFSVGVEDEEIIKQDDWVTCKVRIIVKRQSHEQAAFRGVSKGWAKIQALTPNWKQPKEESWVVMLIDPLNNHVLGHSKKIQLLEAERLGYQHGDALLQEYQEAEAYATESGPRIWDGQPRKIKRRHCAQSMKGGGDNNANRKGPKLVVGEDELIGQLVDFKFHVFKPGMHDLQVICMSDAYLGVDKVIPFKLKIELLSRAEAEGRARGRRKPAEDGEVVETGDEVEELDPEDLGANAAEDPDEEIYDDEWDSEEDGTEETADEEDDKQKAQTIQQAQKDENSDSKVQQDKKPDNNTEPKKDI